MQLNRVRARRTRRYPTTRWDDPKAFALCDGCKFITYHDDLQEQMEYRGGTSPVGTGWLVCPTCYDTPNAQLAPPILKPDPVPVRNPRPDDGNNNTFLITEDGHPIITEGEDDEADDAAIGVT